MSHITILDGGMGKELKRIGAPFRQPEWSALALLEAPEYVATAHRNFIEAGAQVIITNTYALVPFHIGVERYETRGQELARLAAEIARSAADEPVDRRVLVAGSLPPLFGSYQPEKFEPAPAPSMWRMLIDPQAAFVDLWVGETMSSTEEARVLLETVAVGGGGKPVWLAFTLADHASEGAALLRSCEPVPAIAAVLAMAAGALVPVEAVLFNCSQPEVITPALAELAPLVSPSIRLGAYANAFPPEKIGAEAYAANEAIIERRADLTPDRYRDLARQWVAAGATIVGGCCDIYPAHIAALARTFA